jgi:hypothetical protein
MPIVPTPASPMIAIVEEKRLAGPSWAHVDEQGFLTIIDDETKIPSLPQLEQMYVHLSPQGALSLRNLLNRPDIVALIKSNA